MKKQIIHIENAEISLLSQGTEDYISLTDMAHSQMQEHIQIAIQQMKILENESNRNLLK